MADIFPLRENPGVSLAIMPRPRSGDWLEDEIDDWEATGIKTVVSLLEPHEVTDLGLGAEAELCASRGVRFISFPIADRGTPSSALNPEAARK